jgi:hypothetical protein
MASLQLILLGGFQARAAGKEIDVPGRKERALLALLAIPAGESRSRDKLAGLLWSDRGDSPARDSLKQAIFKLRKSLDGVQPSPLLADREFVSLERAAAAVYVAEFEQLIGEGTTESLARAAALYRGDLLDGLDLRDAAFDEWLLMERERLRHLAREALAKLLDRHMTGGAYDQAERCVAALAGTIAGGRTPGAHADLRRPWPDGPGAGNTSFAEMRCKRTGDQTGKRKRAASPGDPEAGAASRRWAAGRSDRLYRKPVPRARHRRRLSRTRGTLRTTDHRGAAVRNFNADRAKYLRRHYQDIITEPGAITH